MSIIITIHYIIDMFKKRNTSKKTTNMHDILVDINAQPPRQALQPIIEQDNPQPYQMDGQRMGIGSNIAEVDAKEQQHINAFIRQQSNKLNRAFTNPYKNQNIGGGDTPRYQHNNEPANGKYDYVMTDSQKLKEEQRKQIQDYFAEFIKTHKSEQEHVGSQNSHQYNKQHEQQHEYNPFTHPQIMQHSQQHFQQQGQQQQQQQPHKPAPMTREIVIEDESGQHIEVVQDYGQISPGEGSDSDNYEDGFENQIIKKTLTRYNYEQISKQLTHAHRQQRKNKLIKQLGRVSYSHVQAKIAKDLRLKKSKKTQLESQIAYIENKIQNRHRDIQNKLASKAKMQTDLDQVRRMLELLYYFGNQINHVDQSALVSLIQDDEWKQRINRIRANIERKKQKFDQLHKKQSDDDQAHQHKSEEGDVEQIPKHKVTKGWVVWDDQMEEDEHGYHGHEGEEDDDECIEIDDD